MQLDLPSTEPHSFKNYLEEIAYAQAVATMALGHRGEGWIWDGGVLKVKSATEMSDDESCHHELFGDLVFRVRFRGWFSKGVLTITDRERETRSVDDIPSQLYNHLMRRFKFKTGAVRIP